MADQQKPAGSMIVGASPAQLVRFMTATTIGLVLLGLSGVTLTGTVIALILSTPLLLIFSPILVPAGASLFLITVGFLFSGGCGVAALAVIAWIYNYVAGKRPLGADKLDYARMKIASAARDVKDRAKEYGAA